MRAATMTWRSVRADEIVARNPSPAAPLPRRAADRTRRRPLAAKLKLTQSPQSAPFKKGFTDMATATKKASKIRLQPLGERIVVQREESESTTAGGIVLPDSAQEKPARGTVIAIGTGKQLDDGSRAPSQLAEGDRVLFSSYAGETVEIDDVEYLLMREDDVLAVFG